jgi:two-component system sensor histidine kinase AgrC
MKPWIILGAGALLLALSALGAWALRRWLIATVDRRIHAYQSDLITKQCQEVENTYLQMRRWRHDYHNHIQTLKAYRALGQDEALDAYLNRLDDDLRTVDTVIKTGNVMVDAIVNSKLSLARARQISLNAKATVPEQLSISPVDLCVILGNLLDNAMEACCQYPDAKDRFLRLYVTVRQDQLYLCVTNASARRPLRQAGGYRSAKGEHHGFGLLRVDHLVDKYGGYLYRADEDGAFSTEILLPL